LVPQASGRNSAQEIREKMAMATKIMMITTKKTFMAFLALLAGDFNFKNIPPRIVETNANKQNPTPFSTAILKGRTLNLS